MMRVIKCGGNCLKKLDDRKKLYQEIKYSDEKVVLVVSAFDDTPYSTDSLSELLKGNYTYEMKQELISMGEIISSLRVCNELLNEYIDATFLYKEDIGIYVKTSNKMDQIVKLDEKKIKEEVLKHKVVVVPGFIGINQNNKIVTLNKNGSDLTAVIMAYLLNCEEVYLYKDVLGLASIDPHLYHQYKLYHEVSYDFMIQCNLHYNHLIQEEALRFAKEHQIKINIQHYLNHHYQTRIDKINKERVIVFSLFDQGVYIDGYNNKETIENILILKEIKYNYILPCNSYLKIVSEYSNEKKILETLHQSYLKGEL